MFKDYVYLTDEQLREMARDAIEAIESPEARIDTCEKIQEIAVKRGIEAERQILVSVVMGHFYMKRKHNYSNTVIGRDAALINKTQPVQIIRKPKPQRINPRHGR